MLTTMSLSDPVVLAHPQRRADTYSFRLQDASPPTRRLNAVLVGHLTRVSPFLQDGPASPDRPPSTSSAPSHSVPSPANTLSSCPTTATPLKRCWFLVPSSSRRF